MGVIYVLITVSLIIALVFFAVFVKAVRSGQYDDTLTPSIRILFENKSTKKDNTQPIDKS